MPRSGRYSSDYLYLPRYMIVHPLAVIAWEWESQSIDKRFRSDVPSDCGCLAYSSGEDPELPLKDLRFGLLTRGSPR
jgi:hypothetical protein